MSELVLITGASGLLGGRIAQALTKDTGLVLRLGLRKHAPVLANRLAGSETVHLDLMSEASMSAACRGVTYVIHLAALNNLDSAADPQKAILVNGLGTLNLLQAAVQAGVTRFIYFSTAHVYGAPLQGVIDEQTLPRPRHPYAITHRIAEDFVLAASDGSKTEGVVIRLSNGVGYPLHAGVDCWALLANDLCLQAVVKKELRLLTAGLQERDFIPLGDIERAAAHFLQLPTLQLADGLFNLGSGKSLRVIDLAHLIAKRCKRVLGFMPEIIRPEPDKEEAPFVYCIDKIKNTGFELQRTLEEEIDATFLFCQKEFAER